MYVPAADESIGLSAKLRYSPHPALRRNIMARFKSGCLRIRSVLFIVLLAAFGLVITAPAALAHDGPDYNINPNHSYADDLPWVEFSDRPAIEAFIGPRYRVTHVTDWMADIGIFEDGSGYSDHESASHNTECKAGDDKQDPGNSR